MEISGNIVDVIKNKIYPGTVKIIGDKIVSIIETGEKYSYYILPGLIDGHIHIESSMLVPSRFAEAVVPHGTVATVSDPHEIANVLGLAGIDYMIADSKSVPLKVFFTAPSCVPATPFETNGATLSGQDIAGLLKRPEMVALGEMMNFPGAINDDPEVLEKIKTAKDSDLPIDGHCPGLTGSDLKKYIACGIGTDHECLAESEAREKINNGMVIMFREGSAAKSLENLAGIIKDGYHDGFLVSDDRHVDELNYGHVNYLLKRAVALGVDPLIAVRMVTSNPARHYNLPVGMLRVKDFADLVVVKDLKDFQVLETYINGRLVAKDGLPEFTVNPLEIGSGLKINFKKPLDFSVESSRGAMVRVIKVVPDQIVTGSFEARLESEHLELQTNTEKDILKIAVCSRYGNNNIGIGFISGFHLRSGAVASSVAHDSHNIVAVGVDNASIAKVVNKLIDIGGGLAVTNGQNMAFLELPVAGLMSREPADEVAKKFGIVNQRARELGCRLKSPFMTLSFMSLLVIPELKISDRGLFDSSKFSFVKLIADNYENFTV